VNRAELLKNFQIQREEFCKLHEAAVRKNPAAASKTWPTPSIALSFAEGLMVCPDAAAAQSHIEKHPTEARAFLVAADKISDDAAEAISAGLAAEPRQDESKFYVLASFVYDYLSAGKKQHPDLWE
jgi:hypothetical protein